jgi:hypothetical protein
MGSKMGSASKVWLNTFDDLFGGSMSGEQIIHAKLSDLHTFRGHPLNGLLDTMSRGGKNRTVYSSVCSVSGVNSAMSFREKPLPKIFNIMFSVWVVTDWLFFSR